MPKVSIIIIIYKIDMFLRECLESVVNQTYKDIEIILVACKGDDKCLNICNEYAQKDNRIKLIVDEPKGTAVARNQGLDAVTGDFIAFIDGDDYVERDIIETMVKGVTEREADVSVVGKYYLYENCKDPSSNLTEIEEYDCFEAFETILYNDKFFLHMWDKLYKKELFDGVRFDEGRKVEDREMACRILLKAKKIVFNPLPKYYFRVSHDSGSRVADNMALSLQADKEICNELLDKFSKEFKDSKTNSVTKAYSKRLNAAINYFLITDTMSVIQNSFLYDLYSKEHDKKYIKYVRSNLFNVALNKKTSKSMIIKMFLCGYMTKYFGKITIKRRQEFLKNHIEFGSGNDWEKTFNDQGIKK